LKVIERLAQFAGIYIAGILILLAIKHLYHLSDYLIPPPDEILAASRSFGLIYLSAVINTAYVAISGHFLAIIFAAFVAFLGKTSNIWGSITKTAAYNLQAYPIVAVSPIIFLFFGDGLASRLIIASLICYFPLLLSFIGIFSQPVDEVEHFYAATGRLNWRMELSIRIFENLDKITTVAAGSGTLAFVGAIVAEFLAATNGIGYLVRKALYQSNLAKILLALFLIGLFTSIYISLIEALGTWIKKRLSGS
jgi:NitT/TauT family transport system permease protein